jgi:hypothetical protein
VGDHADTGPDPADAAGGATRPAGDDEQSRQGTRIQTDGLVGERPQSQTQRHMLSNGVCWEYLRESLAKRIKKMPNFQKRKDFIIRWARSDTVFESNQYRNVEYFPNYIGYYTQLYQ